MTEITIIWILAILAILMPFIIYEIKFIKETKKLAEEFKREAKRIDELEKTLKL